MLTGCTSGRTDARTHARTHGRTTRKQCLRRTYKNSNKLTVLYMPELNCWCGFLYLAAVVLVRANSSYDASEEISDHSPSFTFPLRNRLIQQGIGVKLIACVSARPTPKVCFKGIFKENLQLLNSTSLPSLPSLPSLLFPPLPPFSPPLLAGVRGYHPRKNFWN